MDFKLIRGSLISFACILLYISNDKKFTLAHAPISVFTVKRNCDSLFKIMDKRMNLLQKPAHLIKSALFYFHLAC